MCEAIMHWLSTVWTPPRRIVNMAKMGRIGEYGAMVPPDVEPSRHETIGTPSDKEYQGLVRTLTRIAQHPNYEGKKETLDECVEEIEERCREGRLAPWQRSALIDILKCSQ